jgi:hypothetical protein
VKLTFPEVVVDHSHFDDATLLQCWRWLVGDSVRILMVTALGDLFLSDDLGSVHRLDAGWGTLKVIARSTEEFRKVLSEPGRAEEWFVPELVGDLITSGVRLGPGQCYGYKLPPVLGGKLEPSNLEPTQLPVHFGILGQIHEQTRGVPEGTPVRGFKSK